MSCYNRSPALLQRSRACIAIYSVTDGTFQRWLVYLFVETKDSGMAYGSDDRGYGGGGGGGR